VADRILVVDDAPRVVRLVSEVLNAVGYEVVAAISGPAALATVAREQPDLVLLDVLLSEGMDGYEVCRRIREFSDVPVIMLTAKTREQDVLAGFDAGADDYLTKPFSAKELVARIGAVLRRARRPEDLTQTVLKCGDLEIDFARRSVAVGDEQVLLTRTEYSLLRQLARSPNCVIVHEDLLAAVWGPEYVDDLDYLRAYIHYLRRKLEPDPSHPRYLVTRAGVGYMLACA
jgi:two-component system KDP operon response regulator KdpE